METFESSTVRDSLFSYLPAAVDVTVSARATILDYDTRIVCGHDCASLILTLRVFVQTISAAHAIGDLLQGATFTALSASLGVEVRARSIVSIEHGILVAAPHPPPPSPPAILATFIEQHWWQLMLGTLLVLALACWSLRRVRQSHASTWLVAQEEVAQHAAAVSAKWKDSATSWRRAGERTLGQWRRVTLWTGRRQTGRRASAPGRAVVAPTEANLKVLAAQVASKDEGNGRLHGVPDGAPTATGAPNGAPDKSICTKEAGCVATTGAPTATLATAGQMNIVRAAMLPVWDASRRQPPANAQAEHEPTNSSRSSTALSLSLSTEGSSGAADVRTGTFGICFSPQRHCRRLDFSVSSAAGSDAGPGSQGGPCVSAPNGNVMKQNREGKARQALRASGAERSAASSVCVAVRNDTSTSTGAQAEARGALRPRAACSSPPAAAEPAVPAPVARLSETAEMRRLGQAAFQVRTFSMGSDCSQEALRYCATKRLFGGGLFGNSLQDDAELERTALERDQAVYVAAQHQLDGSRPVAATRSSKASGHGEMHGQRGGGGAGHAERLPTAVAPAHTAAHPHGRKATRLRSSQRSEEDRIQDGERDATREAAGRVRNNGKLRERPRSRSVPAVRFAEANTSHARNSYAV